MNKALEKKSIDGVEYAEKLRGKWLGVLLLLACLTFPASAQQAGNALAELVGAENNFAKQATDTNIKTAFLTNLDSSGVIFDNAKPINGIAAYSQAPDGGQELLSWYPTIAHVSSKGDLGFTSGPYQFFAERGKEPVGSGYFFSIWKRNRAGTFKLLLDGGVGSTKDHTNAFNANPKPAAADYDFLKMTAISTLKAGPWEAEKQFAEMAATDLQEAYSQHLSEVSLLLRNDRKAGLTKTENLSIIAADNNIYQFKQTSRGISESGDLAYCYGKVTWGSGSSERHGFFVRVWQSQHGGWKIVADEVSLVPPKRPSN